MGRCCRTRDRSGASSLFRIDSEIVDLSRLDGQTPFFTRTKSRGSKSPPNNSSCKHRYRPTTSRRLTFLDPSSSVARTVLVVLASVTDGAGATRLGCRVENPWFRSRGPEVPSTSGVGEFYVGAPPLPVPSDARRPTRPHSDGNSSTHHDPFGEPGTRGETFYLYVGTGRECPRSSLPLTPLPVLSVSRPSIGVPSHLTPCPGVSRGSLTSPRLFHPSRPAGGSLRPPFVSVPSDPTLVSDAPTLPYPLLVRDLSTFPRSPVHRHRHRHRPSAVLPSSPAPAPPSTPNRQPTR